MQASPWQQPVGQLSAPQAAQGRWQAPEIQSKPGGQTVQLEPPAPQAAAEVPEWHLSFRQQPPHAAQSFGGSTQWPAWQSWPLPQREHSVPPLPQAVTSVPGWQIPATQQPAQLPSQLTSATGAVHPSKTSRPPITISSARSSGSNGGFGAGIGPRGTGLWRIGIPRCSLCRTLAASDLSIAQLRHASPGLAHQPRIFAFELGPKDPEGGKSCRQRWW